MATTYVVDWAASANPARNEVRFRIQDTGPTTFLFQDEEIDNQLAVETAAVARAKIFFAAARLLETKLVGLQLAGNGVSERKTDDLSHKFGLSSDDNAGETIQKLITSLRAEANRLNLTRPRTLRVLRHVRVSA